MQPDFYFNILYPLQDRILRWIGEVETGFYLTGGTAASRGYLNHRFSDDLDFFVNDDDRFGLWSDRIVQALMRGQDWQVQVGLREARFVRLLVEQTGILLKIEMINDVPSRVGIPKVHPILGQLDTPENILANKVTAILDRQAPKDLADIWGFCCQMGLSLYDAIEGAQGKASGVFPVDLARALCSVTHKDWELVRWIKAPDVDRFISDLNRLGEDLLSIPKKIP